MGCSIRILTGKWRMANAVGLTSVIIHPTSGRIVVSGPAAALRRLMPPPSSLFMPHNRAIEWTRLSKG
jgi:hypothetical protein